MIQSIDQLDLTKQYTYADYLTWQFQERVELIMGRIFRMSTAPSARHQLVITTLVYHFHRHLKDSHCRVFPAPFDVVISGIEGKEDTVVQPDIAVVCDQAKIHAGGCKGAPDLVVEVVSASSIGKDLHEKFNLYEQAGVKEYWVVQPSDRSLSVFVLESGKYQPSKPLTYGDKVHPAILPGVEIPLDEIFISAAEEPEELYNIKKEFKMFD